MSLATDNADEGMLKMGERYREGGVLNMPAGG